jgi:chromosome segregation ATPase
MKKSFLSLVSIVAMLTMFSTSAFAVEQGTQQSWQDRVEQRQKALEEAQAKLAERVAQQEEAVRLRCEKTNSNIEKIIENYDTKVQKHIDTYSSIKSRIEYVVKLLESKGADVSALRTELDTLNEMIFTVATEREQYIATLRESQTLVCGESEGAFKEKIQEARNKLPKIKTDVEAIKSYIKDTIRPELQKLRDSLETSAS